MSFQLVTDFNYFIWVAFDAFIKWYLQEINCRKSFNFAELLFIIMISLNMTALLVHFF